MAAAQLLRRNLCTSTTPIPRTPKPISNLISRIRTADPHLIPDLISEASPQIPRLHQHRPLFHLAVSKLARAHRPDLIDSLLSSPPTPTSDGFLARIISLYSSARMPSRATEAFNSSAISPGPKSISALLSAFIDNRFQLDHLQENFNQLTKRLAITPGIPLYNLLLKGLCQNGDLSAARKVLDEMPQRGLTPNVISYNSLLHGFLDKGDEAGFQEVLSEISNNKLELNVFTYNCRIKNWCQKGVSFKGEELLDVMVSKGLKPDRMSFHSIINGYCEEGDVSSARKVFGKMRVMTRKGECNVTPAPETYNVLVKGLVEKGEFEMAFKVCKESVGKKFALPFEVVKGLVDGLVKQGKGYEAGVVGKKMKMVVKGKEALDAWNEVEKGLALQ
ncbi:Pentatricopeptide repeat-containing protein [Dioscorea alata]|uniref:Pentatricopeptide repeat-containing protein n=1 Tax=Dioscorea alata TaxID=55571 RepID=A0ACB7TZB5_DIOAL|nr:Pentatricopeptide repeat-containing protein [Dioscorea alata]